MLARHPITVIRNYPPNNIIRVVFFRHDFDAMFVLGFGDRKVGQYIARYVY